MEIYLGLGSNLGDRRQNLRAAIASIRTSSIEVVRVSPVIESPALLPPGAHTDWNRPYLNLALRGETELGPDELLAALKRIESEMGRAPAERWAPRVIDIDILLYGSEIIAQEHLQIPHPQLHRRAFVLTPLIALSPGLEIPGLRRKSVFGWSMELDHHIPLWMGIVNVTPDSFSDGGRWLDWQTAEAHIDEMTAAGANIVDLGAESTRPGAHAVSAEDEWSRLEPVLDRLASKFRGDDLAPLISVDTYRADIARRALACGAQIINDVSGLQSAEMIELAADGAAEWVAMHSVSIPADPKRTLPQSENAFEHVDRWIEDRAKAWSAAGVSLDKLYIDPGIGFGKTPLQSLQLLRAAGLLRTHGIRTLIGHSRKSFMSSFAAPDARARDLTTIGASLNLVSRGVDVLRVHNVGDHITAYRGWAHLNA